MLDGLASLLVIAPLMLQGARRLARLLARPMQPGQSAGFASVKLHCVKVINDAGIAGFDSLFVASSLSGSSSPEPGANRVGRVGQRYR